MEKRTLRIGNRIIYCYEDGSVEYKSTSHSQGMRLIRTFGSNYSNGYKAIRLTVNGKQEHLRVHRLIALAFHSNPENLPQVDHINRNKTDNRPSNLRWVTAKENMSNIDKVDQSITKYGVRFCENRKEYNKRYHLKNVRLEALQPTGRQTHYNFPSEDDSIYKVLKPLSRRERYFKYQELKHV